MSDYSGPYGVDHDPSEMADAEARDRAKGGGEKKDRHPGGTAGTERGGRPAEPEHGRSGAESREGDGEPGE
ncbi:hypothetical protein V1L54_19250 [Streptomyces sp. TRM 70361]|uniref:hypothetical protein n=1 Tax=Streptomyces sp. TRM 70361 TaxID=3116553 RepID=UPI002E7AB5A1|nr:hypothetical protein [Streptomyces sp. TRM 70361]MEE1941518.1 hypothetical protein [Streptomyces sp. TRM 70361]